MILSNAIWKILDPLFEKVIHEEDKKKKKELILRIKKLNAEYDKALYKEWTELKKNDVEGIYEDLEPESKKIISDEEYDKLKAKWEDIVGEKLLYPLEQEYQDRRNRVLRRTANKTPEEREIALERFEYEWTHRGEWAQRRKAFERDHKNYLEMINNMTPEEYHNFMATSDPDRASYFKNSYEVKTKDE